MQLFEIVIKSTGNANLNDLGNLVVQIVRELQKKVSHDGKNNG